MAANPPNPPSAQPQPRVYPAVYSGIGVSNFLSDVLTPLRAVDVSSCIPTTPFTRSPLRDARPRSVPPVPSRSVPHSSATPAQSALFSPYNHFTKLPPLRYVILAFEWLLLAVADLKLALDACVPSFENHLCYLALLRLSN